MSIGFFGLCAVVVLIIFARRRTSPRRLKHSHQVNCGRAEDVIALLRRWRGPFRNARIMTYLRKLNPYVFEELVLSLFERQGFKVERSTRYSGDGGIDGRVWKNGTLYLIQVKRYRAHVKLAHIREFSAVLSRNNARGFMIHTGRTSRAIRNMAARNHIEIISGSRLLQWIC